MEKPKDFVFENDNIIKEFNEESYEEKHDTLEEVYEK